MVHIRNVKRENTFLQTLQKMQKLLTYNNWRNGNYEKGAHTPTLVGGVPCSVGATGCPLFESPRRLVVQKRIIDVLTMLIESSARAIVGQVGG